MASHDNKLFAEIIEVEAGIVSTRNATVNLQDYILLLRLNPFSKRSQKARDWRERRDVYLAKLDRDLEAKVEKGTHMPCIQANAMLDDEVKLSKAELTSISVSIIQGGTDTVAGTGELSLCATAQRHPSKLTGLSSELELSFSGTAPGDPSQSSCRHQTASWRRGCSVQGRRRPQVHLR